VRRYSRFIKQKKERIFGGDLEFDNIVETCKKIQTEDQEQENRLLHLLEEAKRDQKQEQQADPKNDSQRVKLVSPAEFSIRRKTNKSKREEKDDDASAYRHQKSTPHNGGWVIESQDVAPGKPGSN